MITNMFTFAPIFIALRAAIAAHAARDRVLSAVLGVLWGRVSRMTDRLERLIVLWRAGRLPQPRVARVGGGAGCGDGEGCEVRRRPSGPRGRYWLIQHVPGAAGYRCQLEYLMSGVEFAAFIAAVPQARRILNPVCRLLGLAVPEAVEPEPRLPEDAGRAVLSPGSADPGVVVLTARGVPPLSLPFPRIRRRRDFAF